MSTTDVRSAFDDFFASSSTADDDDVDNESAENEAEFFHHRFNKASSFAFDINEAADNLAKITDIIKVSSSIMLKF